MPPSPPSRTTSRSYTAVGGTAELRDAIIKRHDTDFGSGYKREQCMASVGGKHALFNAIQVLVDHGDEVILPVPYWVSFKDIIRYAGGEPVFIETDEANDFALTAEMVERAITPRTKLIILNSPNNPSGSVMKPEDITAVVRLANERGIYVISDECYVYLNYTGQLFSAGEIHEAKDRLLIVGSLSKTYAMTGWRLGYVLGPAPVVAAMNKLQSQSTSNPTSIVQKAGVAALNSSQDCIAEMRVDYMRLRDRMVAGPARDSRNLVPDAGRRVLCLPERQPLLWSRWNEQRCRHCPPAAAGSPCGRCARRSFRHQQARAPVVSSAGNGNRSRPRTYAPVLCRPVIGILSGCPRFAPLCCGANVGAAQFQLMSNLYPFLLIPIFDERPWGVRDLRPIYTKIVKEPIGESWLTWGDSCIANGPLAGRTLGDIAREYKRDLVGTAAVFEDRFPLLIKFLFPADKLSVQVHPDDAGAQRVGQPYGKTECWYVLDAEARRASRARTQAGRHAGGVREVDR